MNGVLLLNKPRGMTSHDCVIQIRKALKTKKVGHTGTLDPDVDGVLPIAIGNATKIVPYLTAQSKTYIGEVTVGFSTTTEDASGEVVARAKIRQDISKDEILATLASMIGTSKQIPPMYSAVKVDGKKLYEYARAGIEVKRPEREVTIFSLTLLGDPKYEDGLLRFSFEILGSKGIFIRTVAVEIGKRLGGYPAHMSNLTRIASGPFKLADCITLDDVKDGNFELLPIGDALSDYPRVTVDEWVAKLVKNGVKLRDEQIVPEMKDGLFLICDGDGSVLALYEWDEQRAAYVSVRGLG